MLGEILIGGMGSLFICIFLGPKFIDFMRDREFGQHIREEGPEGHHEKAGTPTMGGLLILLSITVPFLILSDYRAVSLAVLGTALASGALGFVDDWTKVTHRRSLGVSGRYKLLAQAVIAIGLWLVATEYVHLPEILRVHTIDASIDLGLLYPVLIFLVLAGATNGVNLTDGLDGLAAGSAAIVLLAYTAMTFITTGQEDLALLSACLVGACVGLPLVQLVPGGDLHGRHRLARARRRDRGAGRDDADRAAPDRDRRHLRDRGLSVVIQVIAFQRFRRRVFLMAPIHHHFELMAWSETKIILRFWIVAAICSAIGFTLYQQSIQ